MRALISEMMKYLNQNKSKGYANNDNIHELIFETSQNTQHLRAITKIKEDAIIESLNLKSDSGNNKYAAVNKDWIQDKWICPDCDHSGYLNLSDALRHECIVENKFVCNRIHANTKKVCNKTYPAKYKLERHQNLYSDKFKCVHGKRHRSKWEMDNRSCISRWKCDEDGCNDEFRGWPILEQHWKGPHNISAKTKCVKCGTTWGRGNKCACIWKEDGW